MFGLECFTQQLGPSTCLGTRILPSTAIGPLAFSLFGGGNGVNQFQNNIHDEANHAQSVEPTRTRMEVAGEIRTVVRDPPLTVEPVSATEIALNQARPSSSTRGAASNQGCRAKQAVALFAAK